MSDLGDYDWDWDEDPIRRCEGECRLRRPVRKLNGKWFCRGCAHDRAEEMACDLPLFAR